MGVSVPPAGEEDLPSVSLALACSNGSWETGGGNSATFHQKKNAETGN